VWQILRAGHHVTGDAYKYYHGWIPRLRPSLAQADSIASINQAASAEARQVTGRDIPFEFDGIEPQLAREYSEGILRGLERFPKAPLGAVRAADFPPEEEQGDFTWAKTRINGTASGLSESEFNRFRTDAESVNEVLNMKQARGVFVYRDATGLALHEFGHVVHEHYGTSSGAQSLARQYAKLHAPVPVMEAEKRRFGIGHRKSPKPDAEMVAIERRSFLLGEISFYSTHNEHEMAAEAFVDAVTNGEQASPLSIQIMDLLEAKIREGAGR